MHQRVALHEVPVEISRLVRQNNGATNARCSSGVTTDGARREFEGSRRCINVAGKRGATFDQRARRRVHTRGL
jgi:hypothetical protein